MAEQVLYNVCDMSVGSTVPIQLRADVMETMASDDEWDNMPTGALIISICNMFRDEHKLVC